MRWLVHACASEEQPGGDQAPGYERLPERVENSGPCEAAAEAGFAGAVHLVGVGDADGQAGPRECERNDPRSYLLPLKLPKPIIFPCRNAESEEKGVAGEVSELEADDVHARWNELPDRECYSSYANSTKKPPEKGWESDRRD